MSPKLTKHKRLYEFTPSFIFVHGCYISVFSMSFVAFQIPHIKSEHLLASFTNPQHRARAKLTKLQLAKVATADLLAHAEVGSHHEHPGRAGGARGPRRVPAAAPLGDLGAPGWPLTELVSLRVHGMSGSGWRLPGEEVLKRRATPPAPETTTTTNQPGHWQPEGGAATVIGLGLAIPIPCSTLTA